MIARLALRAGRRGGLPIGPYQMGRVVLGDEAHLARRLPRLVDHQIGHDQSVEFSQCVGQRQAGVVVADQADQNALRAKGSDIACHVAGAADLDHAALDREDWRRRLGRNARDVAIDEFVEHDIADAENRLLAKVRECVFDIGYGTRHWFGYHVRLSIVVNGIEVGDDVISYSIFQSSETQKVCTGSSKINCNLPAMRGYRLATAWGTNSGN